MHEEMTARLAFVGLGATQRETLATVGTKLLPLVPEGLDRLYATIERTPDTRRFFRDGNHVAAAKGMQQEHWRRLWSGRFDSDYYDSVRRVGSVHARIGLEPRWYLGSYSIVLETLIRHLMSDRRGWFGGNDGRADEVVALVKAALVDMEVAVSVYFEQAQVERDRAAGETQKREAALAHLLESISTACGAVRTSSQEIAEAAQDLSRRSQTSAASLEQTSAAVGQMNERLGATAQAAVHTVECADGAMATVADGRGITDEAVRAMGRVATSAEGIDQVIEGLDKIAFQTRVLAMNAAVEAGRAGEAGRGFAVVADLVSALAMRAEEEAKRAREQLTMTQTDITAAVGAVRNVDGALAKITGDVQEVHRLLGTIATDNQALSAAVTQVSVAVDSVDNVNRQNVAMIEETAAAAQNLMVEIGQLADRAALHDADADDRSPPVARPTSSCGISAMVH